jgi:hypothetical protein
LKALHHVSNADSTVIDLELDRPVEPHAEALHDPERIFLDLLQTQVAPEVAPTVDVSDSRVRRVRIGRREDATRVVLDLKGACRYSYKMSQHPPYDLVLKLESATP